MKSLLIIVLIVSIVATIVGAQNTYFSAENAIVDLNVSGKVTVVPERKTSMVSYVAADLSFVPHKDEGQFVMSYETSPDPIQKGNVLQFRWTNPDETLLDFWVYTRVRRTSQATLVREKNRFPIPEIPLELLKYTEPSATIDSDHPSIKELAKELSQGENDQFVIASKFALWVRDHVEYNLSTLTAEVSQKSSWVLENRQGVCDEITTLYIALLRAVGIPARFVTGVSYTNSPLFPDQWGPHGWAEVYFPSVGWVPFDPTYGQLGFVDPSHIKVSDSIDAQTVSVKYEWKGNNVNLRTQKLSIAAIGVSVGGTTKPSLSLTLSPLKNSMSLESENIATLEVENNENYYIAEEITLIASEGLELLDSKKQVVILGPRQSELLSWRLKTSADLDPRFAYTFPLLAQSPRNLSAQSSISADRDQVSYERDALGAELDQETDSDSSSLLEAECKSLQPLYYLGEVSQIRCTLKDDSITLIACLAKTTECKKMSRATPQIFSFFESKAGKKEIEIILRSESGTISVFVPLVILDPPSVEVIDVTHHESIAFPDRFSLNFTIHKSSSSIPRNLTITLVGSSFSKRWELDNLYEDTRFVVTQPAKELSEGENEYRIVVEFFDERSRRYESKLAVDVELLPLTLWQKLLQIFVRLGNWISKPT